ncbi:MAG: DEAD/DEAH box helicase family protein [Pirellulales bacterium]|nr:DEAD/DEAH box helicase family protein [Alphaproteobacteria bacterium]MDA8040985.1 DEAD/DEAH box helicase family protein [Pirellulales bacterium]
MPWIDLKSYQEQAIARLKRAVNDLLETAGEKVCIFKSPTGSGKTLMIAEFLKRLIDSRDDGRQFSFIWVAVNKLHDQSRNSLKKYYDPLGIGLKCSYFVDLDDRKIGENEILFLNWSSINKKDNLYIRENEKDNNLSRVVERTKDEGRIIILVIDESHRNAETAKSKALIADIAPKVTVEVSATPQFRNVLHGVEVELRDVKNEGMIKKEIVINPGFSSKVAKKSALKTADQFVLESALEKRAELAASYQAENSNVNPLVLVQIPDSRKGQLDKKDAMVKALARHGITTENGRLAIYLSDKKDKTNLENIEKNENEVEVLIFKQAIAVGWDCPRAAILVLLREWRSMVFSIQTVGRIMRMPEHHHYSAPGLNVGYVFTSLQDIGIMEDISKEYITRFEGSRRKIYADVDLLSYHSKRFREETRLSAEFVPIFFKAAEELKLKSKISVNHSIVEMRIIADAAIRDVDKEMSSVEKKGEVKIPKNEEELQEAFDMFARENLLPFSPELRSIKRINDSLYRFFEESFKLGLDDWPRIQGIVLAEKNRQAVIDAINRAKELYQESVGAGKHELVQNALSWNVPATINYNDTFVKKGYKRSIIRPYYAKSRGDGRLSHFEEDSRMEVKFIKYLEKAKQVKWWFKNGKQDGSYLAVPYLEGGVKKPFYLDFVVMLKNGQVGLFDIKGGIYAETAVGRAEGLAKYIRAENKKGKNLFGGIVVLHKNNWHWHSGSQYSYDERSMRGWKLLDLN